MAKGKRSKSDLHGMAKSGTEQMGPGHGGNAGAGLGQERRDADAGRERRDTRPGRGMSQPSMVDEPSMMDAADEMPDTSATARTRNQSTSRTEKQRNQPKR
jgi:hypothetical protein